MALPAAIALSGLNEEYFSDGLHDVYSHGSVLLKSPSLTSVASTDSQESGISSMSTSSGRCSVVKNLGHFFEMLFNSQNVELKDVNDELSPQSNPVHPSKIFYEKRNILDLAANIEWKWDFKMAELQSGPRYFFENRSQYSRVLGAQIPEHVIITCSFDECSFKELRYE